MLFYIIFTLVYLILIANSLLIDETKNAVSISAFRTTSINRIVPLSHMEIINKINKRSWHKHDDDENEEDEDEDEDDRDDGDKDKENENDEGEDCEDEDEDDNEDDEEDDNDDDEEDDDDKENGNDEDDEECDHWRHTGDGDKWNPKEASGHWHSHDDDWWHSGKDEDDCQKRRPSHCEYHKSTDWKTTTDLRTKTTWFTKTKCQCSKTEVPTPSKIITTVHTDTHTTATNTNINTVVSSPKSTTTQITSNTSSHTNSKPETLSTTKKSATQLVNTPTQVIKHSSSVKQTTLLSKPNNATPSTQATTKSPTIKTSEASSFSVVQSLSSSISKSSTSTTIILDSSEEVEETSPIKHISIDTQSSSRRSQTQTQTQHPNTITSSETSRSVSIKTSTSASINTSTSASIKTSTSASIMTSTSASMKISVSNLMNTSVSPSLKASSSSLMENSLISSIHQSVVSSPSPKTTTSTEISKIATDLTTQLTKISATSKSISVHIFGSIRDDLSLVQGTETTVSTASTNGEIIMGTDSTYTPVSSTVSNSKISSKSINAFPSSTLSYSPNSVTQSSQSITSTFYESSNFESSTSFVSSDDSDLYDSDLLSLGTQSMSSILSEASASYDSVTITPNTVSYYSSVVDGTTQIVTSISGSSSNYESNSEASFVSSNDEDSYDSDLLHEGTQPKYEYISEFSTDTTASDTISYYSSGSDGASQTVTSIFGSSSMYESSVSFVSSDNDSYDSDLLHEGTQPKYEYVSEFSTDFDSITTASDTISYYSSGSNGATKSLSNSFLSNSVYNSDYGTLSLSIASSENTESLKETAQSVFSTSSQSDFVYDSVTITPDTVATTISSLFEIVKTSDFTSSIISSVESSHSASHFSDTSIDVDNGGSLSTLSSHSVPISSSGMSFSMTPSITVTSSTLAGSFTASSSTEDVSSCDDYSTFMTTNVEGSVVHRTSCIDSLISSQSTLISDVISSIDSSISSGRSEIIANFTSSAPMLSVQSSYVLSSMESSIVQSYVSSTLTESSSIFTALSKSTAPATMETGISSAPSSMETVSSCDEYTITLIKNAYGSLVSQAVCVESSSNDYSNFESFSDSGIAPITASDSIQGTISFSNSDSVELTSFCDHLSTLLTKDSNGVLISKTICDELIVTGSQYYSTLESDTAASVTVIGSQSLSSLSVKNSLETVLSCDQTITILNEDANGSMVLRTICAESSHISQSGSSYVSGIDSTYTLSSTDYTDTIPTSSISDNSNCDQYTTYLGRDVNGALLTQSVCIESISILSDESSLYTSSIKSTPTKNTASLSSAVRSVNSFSTCDQLSTVLSRDAKGSLIPQTTCIDSSVSSATTTETLDSSSIHTITANSIDSSIYRDTSTLSTSIHSSLSSVTPMYNCDSFSTFLIKYGEESLVTHTVCIESSSEISATVSSTATFTSNLLDKSTALITISSTKAISSLNSQLTLESSQIVGTSTSSTISMTTSRSFSSDTEQDTLFISTIDITSSAATSSTSSLSSTESNSLSGKSSTNSDTIIELATYSSIFKETDEFFEEHGTSTSNIQTATSESTLLPMCSATTNDFELASESSITAYTSSDALCATGAVPTSNVSLKPAQSENASDASSLKNSNTEVCNTVEEKTLVYITSQTMESVSSTLSPSSFELYTFTNENTISGSSDSDTDCIVSSSTDTPITTSSTSLPSYESIICNTQETTTTMDNSQCVVNSNPNTNTIYDNDNPPLAPGINENNSNEGKPSDSLASSSNSNNSGGNGGSSSSSSSSSSGNGGNNLGDSSSSSSGGTSGGSSSSSSSSGTAGNGVSSSSSSSGAAGNGGSSSSSSSSSGAAGNGGSSSSSSSSGGAAGNGGSSSSSSSSGGAAGNGGSSSSSSSSSGTGGGSSSLFSSGPAANSGVGFVDSSLNSNAYDTSPANAMELSNKRGDSRYSSRSRHSSTSSSSTSNTSENGTSIHSSSTSTSESNILEDSTFIADANGNSATTRKQTESSSFSDNLSETSLGQNGFKVVDDKSQRKDSLLTFDKMLVPAQDGQLGFEENVVNDTLENPSKSLYNKAALNRRKEKGNIVSKNIIRNKLKTHKNQDREASSSVDREDGNDNNDSDTNKFLKRKHLLKKPTLRKKVRYPSYYRSVSQ